MTILTHFLSQEIIYALGWTMVHSLWQGALIGFLLYMALKYIPIEKAHLRYEISSFALFTTLLAALVTFIWYVGYSNPVPGLIPEHLVLQILPANTSNSLFKLNEYISNYAPSLVLIWIIGMLVFCIRMVGGYGYVIRLQSRQFPNVDISIQRILERLSKKAGLGKSIRLVESLAIKIPMTIGHLKPVILLPIGLATYLTPRQVEALIAHEFAHILRNDFLMNLFQMCMETIFYFHPAVWWISGQVREEREAACDDIAVKLTGDPVMYASTLYTLKERNHQVPALAMSVLNKRTSLYNRISRLLNQPISQPRTTERLFATLILLGGLLLLSFTTQSGPINLIPVDEKILLERIGMESIDIIYVKDTIPRNKSLKHRIKKHSDVGEMEILLEGSDVKELYMDGHKINLEDFPKYERLIQQIKEELNNLQPPPQAPAARQPEAAPVPPSPPTPETGPIPPEAPNSGSLSKPKALTIPPPPPPAQEVEIKKTIKKKGQIHDHDESELDDIALEEKIIMINVTTDDQKTSEEPEYMVTARYDSSIELLLEDNLNQAQNVWISESGSSNLIGETEEIHVHIRKMDQKIKKKLVAGGVISGEKSFSLLLSNEALQINGKTQPENVHETYRNWWEESAGVEMPAKFRLEIKHK